MFIIELIEDGFFAAIAAIGFGSISNVPLKAFSGCALLAAMGHATRYALMNGAGWSIVLAALVASLVIGFMSIPFARWWRCPAESLSFPALLPMIPGMYAYRTVESFVRCLTDIPEEEFHHFNYLLGYNAMMTVTIIALMVIGVTIPLFIFGNIPYAVTRRFRRIRKPFTDK